MLTFDYSADLIAGEYDLIFDVVSQETVTLQHTIKLTLTQDPCLTFTYSIPLPDPFPDKTRHAISDQEAQTIPWNINTLFTKSITDNCGPNVVEFLIQGTDEPLNSAIFTDLFNTLFLDSFVNILLTSCY